MQIDLTQPPPRPETLEEAHLVIQALWGVIGELRGRVAELEEKLRIGSSNSSKPPSSDAPWKKMGRKAHQKSGKKRGGQPGHPGVRRELLPPEAVDEVVSCRPKKRCPCGGVVELDPGEPERRQVFELPEVKPKVTEYQVYRGACTRCHQRVAGEMPAGAPVGMLGPRAMAFVAELTGRYHMSQREVADLLEGHFGILVSPGTVAQTEARVSEALAAPVAEVREVLKGQPVVHMDETGSKIAGKRAWTWIALTDKLATFVIRHGRGAEVARELLGKSFAGLVVSDRWSAYSFLDPRRRQLCWAHLLRDFTRIQERGGASEPVGTKLLALGHQLFHLWHQFQDGLLSREPLAEAMRPVQAAILTTLEEGTHCDDMKTSRACENILKLKAALFNFVTLPGVEPTNNRAERGIRPYVLWRKTSFGTQGETGTTFVERILTVVATCRAQGRNSIEFITQAIRDALYQRPPPSLLPA